MKNNLSFYRHETGSHNHWKFKTLRRRYGWAGEGKFWALNNMIADAEWCALDLSDEGKKIAVATDLDFDPIGLNEFIQHLIHVCKLIVEDDHGFLMTGIVQETFEEVRGRREYQRSWKKSSSTSKQEVSSSKESLSMSKVPKSILEKQQSKVKESKEKEREAGEPPNNEVVFKKKEDQFYQQLATYVSTYGKNMLRNFFDYWREPNKSRTKMRWEQERTWDLELRLKKWQDNEYTFKNGKEKVVNGTTSNKLSEAVKKLREEETT